MTNSPHTQNKTGANYGPEIFLGLISGTSVDAIDAALVQFNSNDFSANPKLLAHCVGHYDESLRSRILELSQHNSQTSLDEIGELDCRVGEAFASTAIQLINQTKIDRTKIRAIGSHGQTLRHRPNATHPFTMQTGDANIIAARTGITTVADFRRRDIAEGGQGAPLVPAFHRAVFSHPNETRVVLNLGGIANITILPKQGKIIGFDTGPANGLMDAWVNLHQKQAQDLNGEFACSGSSSAALLDLMLSDPYFVLSPPKSTGRDYFHVDWLQKQVNQLAKIKPADVQATLVQLLVQSVYSQVIKYAPDCARLLVCGGGVHNTFVMKSLRDIFMRHNNPISVQSTQDFDLNPDYIEAMAFAWLARETLAGRPGNLIDVTGANKAVILGSIYLA